MEGRATAGGQPRRSLMIEPAVLGGAKGIFPADGTARTFESCRRPRRPRACRYQRMR
ncbi:MAG: hypothetical protein ACRD03_14155 [Acidimicrobiales bacterium]